MNPAMTPTEQFTPSPLIGERVVLRPFQEADITEGYLGWLNDPEVTQYLEVGKAPVTILEVRKYVERFRNNTSDRLFAIVHRQSQQHIGNVTLNDIDHSNGTANTGLMIGEKSYWGKGYSFEVWSLVLEYAFRELALRKVLAGAVVGNAPSIRTLEKLGFQPEGTLIKTVAGKPWHTFRFSLDREALWSNRHSATSSQ